MAAGRTSVHVRITDDFMPGLEPGRWTTMDPIRPELLPVDSLLNFPGIADPSACAERSEAILTPAIAYLERSVILTPKAKSVTVSVRV
jgi:hypothetical protein